MREYFLPMIPGIISPTWPLLATMTSCWQPGKKGNKMCEYMFYLYFQVMWIYICEKGLQFLLSKRKDSFWNFGILSNNNTVIIATYWKFVYFYFFIFKQILNIFLLSPHVKPLKYKCTWSFLVNFFKDIESSWNL